MKLAPNLESPDPTTTVENRLRQWSHVIRPLAWWSLLVLLLFGYQKHIQWRDRTRAKFTVLLDGRDNAYQVSSTVDGKQIANNEKIPLFKTIQLVVSHPKYEVFSTNFFVGYGEHNIGTINLKRSKGTLVIKAKPPAALITIEGPEFSLSLTNSSGTTTPIPTDHYVVKVSYARWEKQEDVSIYPAQTGNVDFAPRLCLLKLLCNISDASFQLNQKDGRLIEAGHFPFEISDLPEGKYQLVAQHHGHQQQQSLNVKSGETNDAKVTFIYGAAVFETTPSGASVIADNSRELGQTPLTLPELEPGIYNFKLRRDGYETLLTKLEIVGNETRTFRTNLVNTSYIGAIKAAREALAAREYGRAFDIASDALLVQPNDPVANSLKREATGLENLNLAVNFGKNGDYIAGIKNLLITLEALPENEGAKQLLADFRKHEPEQLEKQRVTRLNRGNDLFKHLVQITPYAELFEKHELKTTKPVKEVGDAIVSALKFKPAFQIKSYTFGTPETFQIEGTQELMTVLSTSAGRRQCLIVGAQTKDDETQILFAVVEFKTEAQIKFSLGNLIGTPGLVNYVPVHVSKIPVLTEKLQAKVVEGVSNLTARIEGAVGKSAELPTPSANSLNPLAQ